VSEINDSDNLNSTESSTDYAIYIYIYTIDIVTQFCAHEM